MWDCINLMTRIIWTQSRISFLELIKACLQPDLVMWWEMKQCCSYSEESIQVHATDVGQKALGICIHKTLYQHSISSKFIMIDLILQNKVLHASEQRFCIQQIWTHRLSTVWQASSSIPSPVVRLCTWSSDSKQSMAKQPANTDQLDSLLSSL